MTHPKRGEIVLFEGEQAEVVCCYLNSIDIKINNEILNVNYNRIKRII